MFIGLILRIFAPLIQQWMNAKYGNREQPGQVQPNQYAQPGQYVQPQPPQPSQPAMGGGLIGQRQRRNRRSGIL